MSDQDKPTPPQASGENDPLAGLEEHLRPPEEGARAAGHDPDDEQLKRDDGDEDEADITQDQPDEDETEEEEDYREKYERLKRTVGEQANELGDLRKMVREMAPQAQPQTNEFDQRVKQMRDRWGDELTDSILELVRIQVEPVRASAGVMQLQQRYPDFNEMKGDMEKILSKSPALRDAAMKDSNVLDTVYEAAKAARLRNDLDDRASKEKAKSRKVASMRDEAHVERPTKKEPPPKELSAKERNAAFVDHLIGLKPNE